MKLNYNKCLNVFPGIESLKVRLCVLILFVVFFHFISISTLRGASYDSTILAMYKSQDGYSENNNPIKKYFEPEIKKLGLEVRYHDFNRGFPDINSLSNVRAILTWYINGVVRNKETGMKYAAFLNTAVDMGIKLIIVNSFGAYGYNEGGVVKWDLIQYINPLFIKLGFNFKGYWTNDVKKLSIVYKRSSMVEKDAKQNLKKSQHYQQIIPLRDDVTTYLQIRRTDKVKGIGDGKSSVILTSMRGGFALEQYVMQGNKLLLNPPLFLRRSLFYDEGVQNIAVIIGNLKNRDWVLNNINYACKYAKIDHTYINVNQLNSMVSVDLSLFEAVLVAVDNVNDLRFPLIKKYVSDGGRLIFLQYAILNKQFMNLLGLKEYMTNNTNNEYFEEGFSIKPDFFMNRMKVSGKKIGINVQRAKLTGARVLASARQGDNSDSYPLLWERSIGKGKILYWNSDMLLIDKDYRGTIIQSIHYIYPGFVTGLANVAMMMIDDFPAPLWNINYRQSKTKLYRDLLSKEANEDISDKLKKMIKNLKKYPNINDTNYIKDFWIKDILAFQKQFGFKYSCFIIFNYDKDSGLGRKVKNFAVKDLYKANGVVPVNMGRRALQSGWDFGLHGYNHMSLTITKPEQYDSNPWPDRETMVEALTVARKEWELLYGASTLPFSYVAPHNVIDDTGLSALGEAFPSIKVVSALYIGRQSERDQEFAWTGNRRFYQMPRMTSGHHMSYADRYVFYDVIHNFGVISHFIHPDDAFDSSRSNEYSGWKWMKAQFVKEYSLVKKSFPWLRWMTVKDAFFEMQFYENTNIRVKRKGKVILVESSDGSDRYLYFRIRLKKGQKVARLHNCKMVNFNKKSGDVIFKTRDHLAKIVLR